MAAASEDYDEERLLLLERFGKIVRKVRKTRDISQAELARRCGLHRTEISLVERGLRAPRLCTLLLIATELDVPATALLKGLPVPRTRRGAT